MQNSLKKHHQYQKSTPKKRFKDDVDLDPTICARVMTEPDDMDDEMVPLYSDDNDNFQSFVQVNDLDINELEKSKDDIFKSLSLSFYNTKPEDMIICTSRPQLSNQSQENKKIALPTNDEPKDVSTKVGPTKIPLVSLEDNLELKSADVPSPKSKINGVNPIEKAKALMNRISGAGTLNSQRTLGQGELYYQEFKKLQQKENMVNGKASSTTQHYQISLKKNESKLGVKPIEGGPSLIANNSSKELITNVSSSTTGLNSASKKQSGLKANQVKKPLPVFDRKFTIENIKRPATATSGLKHSKIISPNKKSMVASVNKKLKGGAHKNTKAILKEEFGTMKRESNYVKDIKIMLDRSQESRSGESSVAHQSVLNLGRATAASSSTTYNSVKCSKEVGKLNIKLSRHLLSRDSNNIVNDSSRGSSIEKSSSALHDSLEKKPGCSYNWDKEASTKGLKPSSSKCAQNSFKNILNRIQGGYVQSNVNMPLTKMRGDKTSAKLGKENKTVEKTKKSQELLSKKKSVKLNIKPLMDVYKNDNSDYILLSNRSKGSPLRGGIV